jgi:hypothetical protein
MDILKAIECGIGLAEPDPSCAHCQAPRRSGGACPTHAAPNVLRILREFDYVARAWLPGDPIDKGETAQPVAGAPA